MSTITQLISRVRSGIVSINFYNGDQITSSGSGFIYKGHIVSNSHVFNPDRHPFPHDTVVGIRFGDTSQFGNDDMRIEYGQLELIVGSDELSNDYAVYRSPIDLSGRHNFEIDSSSVVEGQKIIFMGYPFGSTFMTSHVGYVSAIHQSAGINCYQLDASVNAGNSGGPLLDIQTGKVIGIITRKKTGLSEQFDELIKALNRDIEALSALGESGTVLLMGVDPLATLQESQERMLVVAKDIKRSSNTGIGLAFSCERLREEVL